VIGASGPVYSDDDGNPVPVDAGGLEVMSMALLSDDGPLAWRGAMAHAALSDLFETTAWSARTPSSSTCRRERATWR